MKVAMKITLALIVLALLLVSTAVSDDLIIGAPVGSPVTMTGAAIRLVPSPNTALPLICASILIQVQPGTVNVIYVLNAAPSITMAYNGAGTTTVATLGPGTSTQPGQSLTYPSSDSSATQSGGVDMRYFGLYGTNAMTDTATATCAVKQ